MCKTHRLLFLHIWGWWKMVWVGNTMWKLAPVKFAAYNNFNIFNIIYEFPISTEKQNLFTTCKLII